MVPAAIACTVRAKRRESMWPAGMEQLVHLTRESTSFRGTSRGHRDRTAANLR